MNKEYILGIDPSNVHSAYCLVELPTLKPIEFGFKESNDMLEYIENIVCKPNTTIYLAIETIQNLGMLVGQTVFDTCILVGRLYERAMLVPLLDGMWQESEDGYEFVEGHKYKDIRYIYRRQEKMNICGNTKAKDANIIQALIDRFAKDTPNKGKGSKANQGWFYGFKADIWQAYAIAVTYHDLYYITTHNSIKF